MEINPIVNGIALVPIIVGLVQFAKKFGLTGEKLTALAGGLGVVFGIIYQVAQMFPAAATWFGVIVYGLAVGLSCAGLYDFAKSFTNGRPTT